MPLEISRKDPSKKEVLQKKNTRGGDLSQVKNYRKGRIHKMYWDKPTLHYRLD